MKRNGPLLLSCGLTLLIATQVFAASEQIIKQRAKDLRDQNNAQQGATPVPRAPAQPGTPQTPAQTAPAVPLTPQQQAMARLQADLSAMRPGTQVTPEMKQQLTRDLIAISQATPKPSGQAAMRLSEDLASALSQKLLSNATRGRLAQNLNGILNPATTQPSQVADIVTDIQSIFESNGVPAADAKRAAEAAKAAAAELRKPAAK
jgi:hypothetical protein